MKYIIYLLICFLSLNSFSLNVPKLTGPVVDETGLLESVEKRNVEEKIKEYFKKSTNQISVLLINSLQGESLEEFSIKVADQWQLGSKEKDNGVLLLFAIKDRKFRIEVGQGLEGFLTDAESSRIQRQITPFLKESKYGEAVLREVELVIETISKNSDPEVIEENNRQREMLSLAISQQNEKIKEMFFLIINFVIIGLSSGYVFYKIFTFFKFPSKLKEKRKNLQEFRNDLRIINHAYDLKKKELDQLNSYYNGSFQKKYEHLEQIFFSLQKRRDSIQNNITKVKDLARKNGESI